MEELVTIITNAAREYLQGDKFKSLIEKKIEECLKSIVEGAMSSWSDFGKAIDAHIKSNLNIDLRDLGIAGYNQTVLAVIQQKLDHAIEVVGVEKLKKDMAKLLDGHAPKSIKLSELVKQFKRWAKKEYRGETDRDRVTIIVEPVEYSSRWINLDPKPNQSKYQCRFRLLVSTSEFSPGNVSFSISGIDPSKAPFAGAVYGFDKTLFHLYAAGTTIEVDQTEFDCNLTPSFDEDGEEIEEEEDELV